jgi:predicted deacylase
LSYGTFEGPQLPTGGADPLAVIIAQGQEEGPTLWLTANIHGNEIAGITAIHRFLRPELCSRMRGAIVAMPSLNPAGLRTNRRHPYYDDRDPNRAFPGQKKDGDEPREPSVYERLATRLLESMRGSANLYVDLHCASILSVGFSIRDRVLYRNDSERRQVELLSARLDEMVAAFGFPAVVEFRSKTYVAKELHRSTTGAALQELRIPAFTVELGAHSVVDRATVDACVIGLRNLMRWAGMLDGPAEEMPQMPRPPDNRPRRREDGPYPATTGILDFRVKPGEYLPDGGVVAHISDIWGRPAGDGVLRVSADTWIIGLEDGLLAYPGAAVAHIGVPEEGSLVEPWPD